MFNPYRLIEFGAKINPTGVALDDGYESFSYWQLFVLVKQAAAKLQKIGVKKGSLIVTCLPPKLDWMLTHALFHEACLTCSNHGYNPIDPLLEVDWIITDRNFPHFPQEKLIVIDSAWVEAMKQEPIDDVAKEYSGKDELCRLVLTSGTTGYPKAATFTVGKLESRLKSIHAFWSVTRGEINLMSLATVGGFMTALGAMLTGDPYYSSSGINSVKLIKERGIRSIVGSPTQLAELVKIVESTKESLPSIKEIRSAGGALSRLLLSALKRNFDAAVYNIYGSTEVGGATYCLAGDKYVPSFAGFVLHDANIEIVDASDQPLPEKEEGDIRIRTPHMVHQYFKNPEATAKFFRDGWFYPGDRGRLTKNGLLVLSGRVDELINLGGVKLNPATIDEFLVNYEGIDDAAAFGIGNESGGQLVAVAVVAPSSFDLETLKSKLLKKFGKTRSPTLFFRTNQIPRNEMGKVMRMEISRKFSEIWAKRKIS
jgi:long-chain acyl-CoA synthetase